MHQIPNSVASRALILAPLGRDAAVAGMLLRDAAIRFATCTNVGDLLASLSEETCFAVIAEEALRSCDLSPLSTWLDGQPTWSDMPFIILTRHGSAFHPDIQRISKLLGNVTLLERPFHPLTFMSVAKTAYKGRFRQYEARARIEELRESEERLEQRVAERTEQLKQAHAAILAEMTQRQNAEEKLRQSQKLEMIGQLTGGVAHDFNNLLMAVISNLDLLRRRVSTDSTALRLIDGAMHGAQRGAALTQRLLAFARRQDLKTEPTDLSQLVRDMRNLIERSIGNQIELIMQTRRDLPRVMVDANQVEMAVLNLAVNARDAMPNGGVLTITIDDATTDQPPGLQTGSYVRLLVADTGIGMDSKTLNKATEPFFSTKELGKGTGLGLSMIDGLARQLGGALRLRSIVGQGTTAEFWLPATTIQPATDVTARQVKIEPNTRKLTVLIVDDDALILMSTAMMVEDLGHDVIDVNSGLDALNVLRSGRAIDLLITDFSMPRMNGAELATAAREIIPALPILLATGYAELPSGADPTLVRIGKPYQQAQLSDAVAKAMRSTRSA